MYTFFTIVGFIFITIAATFINYIYDVFSINKFTNFIKKTDNKSIWNDINITIVPILVWSLIELPLLGENIYFLLSVILNIFISCSLIYEIRYGAKVFFNRENNVINLISIYIATLFGQVISYMILNINVLSKNGLSLSIIGMIILLVSFYVIQVKPPKNSFFRENKK